MKDMEVTFGGRNGGDIKLSVWVDADNGTCPDTRCPVSDGAVTI